MYILSTFAQNSNAFVIASSCPLYTAPDFTSEIVQYEQQDYFLSQNQEVEVLTSEGDFVLVVTEDNVHGYVYRYYITQNQPQEVYPVFNCSVRKETEILDLAKNSTGYLVDKDARVFIYNGFDKIDGGYTEVQVVLADGSLYNGLIKSSDLKPDGINRNVLIAIPIICAGVTVILSIIFIERKKKKKQKSGS